MQLLIPILREVGAYCATVNTNTSGGRGPTAQLLIPILREVGGLLRSC